VTDVLTNDCQEQLVIYHRLFVGFSGGLDSTVLLHSLASHPILRGLVTAVYVHHGLSVNASAWQKHCETICKQLQIPFVVCPVLVDGRANIEERARHARYQAFSTLVDDDDALLLAHHSDDQAETLLLQLFRGAGIHGLSAMHAQSPLKRGTLIRPFLEHTRQQLEAYAFMHQLIWIEDESNHNPQFSRNYLRHHIMPLLQEKWPGIVGNLNRTARHCQQAKKNLADLAKLDCLSLQSLSHSLDLSSIQQLEHHRLVNVVREWLEHRHVRLPCAVILTRIIQEVVFSRRDATAMVEWDGMSVRRYQHRLYLLKSDGALTKKATMDWLTFPAPIENIHASRAEKGIRILPGQTVQVRFRQGGELFLWHKQTKQLKKLWQDWQVPPWERDQVPLLYVDDVLASVVGYAVSDAYFSEDNQDTYIVVGLAEA
jgi:tRNA(Ile)-lysidine synthase